ncbi:MAG TPA: hypothetical protein VJZ26_07070 [Blastocatellia bacterium]|nr:hypothetical protein [Blastocatellia bacterium]
MSALQSSIEAFNLGQKVQTSFGPGIVSAISRIDSIIYVILSKKADGLYLFRPEQVEVLDNPDAVIGK